MTRASEDAALQRTPLGPPPLLREASLAEVGHSIEPGDLLQKLGGPGLVDRAIGCEGRSRHVHSALAAWWAGDLMAIHTAAWGGCRAEYLANLVAASPGRWQVYRAIGVDQWSRRKAVAEMRRMTGRRYGWRAVLRVALSRAPVLRWLWPIVTDDAANGTYPPYCSQAVAWAWREAGHDPVPNLPDARTEPGDLARSLMFRPFCTLVP